MVSKCFHNESAVWVSMTYDRHQRSIIMGPKRSCNAALHAWPRTICEGWCTSLLRHSLLITYRPYQCHMATLANRALSQTTFLVHLRSYIATAQSTSCRSTFLATTRTVCACPSSMAVPGKCKRRWILQDVRWRWGTHCGPTVNALQQTQTSIPQAV